MAAAMTVSVTLSVWPGIIVRTFQYQRDRSSIVGATMNVRMSCSVTRLSYIHT